VFSTFLVPDALKGKKTLLEIILKTKLSAADQQQASTARSWMSLMWHLELKQHPASSAFPRKLRRATKEIATICPCTLCESKAGCSTQAKSARLLEETKTKYKPAKSGREDAALLC